MQGPGGPWEAVLALARWRWRTPRTAGRRKLYEGGCDLHGFYWESREETTALAPKRPESRLRPNRAALACALDGDARARERRRKPRELTV